MSLLDRKVRGFKLVDVVALGLLAALVLGVYLAKTMAGRERTEIARVERQISAERPAKFQLRPKARKRALSARATVISGATQ